MEVKDDNSYQHGTISDYDDDDDDVEEEEEEGSSRKEV